MAAIVKEISSVKAFVRSKRSISGIAMDSQLMTSFIDTVIKLINNAASFNATDAAYVNDALTDSPFDAPGTARIASAIDARLKTSQLVGASGKSQGKVPSQTVNKPWLWLVDQDWAAINDKRKSYTTKQTIIIERFNAFGCTNPEEQTMRRMLAMLLSTSYETLPPAAQLYQKLQDFKSAVISERKQWPHEHVLEFPEKPQDLPEHVFKYAYCDAAPVAMEISGIKTIIASIPLRSNSKLLKGKQKPIVDERSPPRSAPSSGSGYAVRADGVAVKREPSAIAPSADMYKQLADVISIEDHEERALLVEYEAKLNKLRVDRERGPASSSAPLPPLTPTLSLTTNPDGSVKLVPRVYGDVVKQETPSMKAEPEVPEPAGETGEPLDERYPSLKDLDPYARAALDAMAKKRGIKADAAKAAKATKSEKGDSKKGVKKETIKKKPAAKSEPPPDVSKAVALKSMPSKMPKDDANPAPIHYNGGTIYTSRKRNAFRAMTIRGNYNTERGAAWGSDKPQKRAWTSCMKMIDDARKKK